MRRRRRTERSVHSLCRHDEEEKEEEEREKKHVSLSAESAELFLLHKTNACVCLFTHPARTCLSSV